MLNEPDDTNKPVRTARRLVRKRKGNGNGGKHANSIVADPAMQAYLKGKEQDGNTSGKGYVRKNKQPLDEMGTESYVADVMPTTTSVRTARKSRVKAKPT